MACVRCPLPCHPLAAAVTAPRLSVPVEWERLQAIRERGGSPEPRADSLELPGVTARRSNSSGNPASIPFGAGIPEGGPYAPVVHHLHHGGGGSGEHPPFPSGLQAVASGGALSLGAMQAALAYRQQYPGLFPYYPPQYPAQQGPRRSDNSSLTSHSTAEGAPGSMHSTTSEGQHAASMAGARRWLLLPGAGRRGPAVLFSRRLGPDPPLQHVETLACSPAGPKPRSVPRRHHAGGP